MLRVLRFIAGAVVAIAIWWYATPAYDALLCRALHLVGVVAEPLGRAVTVSRVGALPIHVPADQLTYNFILFAGLVTAMPPRVWRGIVAFLVLCVVHAIALYTTIEATYALHLGAYSESHYSSLAQDFWKSAEFIYRIGGMFAISFVCWYAATRIGARESQRETSTESARRAPARRKARAARR
jgi:hypothetical protein